MNDWYDKPWGSKKQLCEFSGCIKEATMVEMRPFYRFYHVTCKMYAYYCTHHGELIRDLKIYSNKLVRTFHDQPLIARRLAPMIKPISFDGIDLK
jgi:hypothetical protein